MEVISSPLGGPGAAREGAWADLLGFPWAIPFRVGSVKEKGKYTGFEWWSDQALGPAHKSSPLWILPKPGPLRLTGSVLIGPAPLGPASYFLGSPTP